MGPVHLIFAAGVIKYGERTRALYLASLENFKESTIKMPNQGDDVDLASVGQDEEEDNDKKLARVFHFFQIVKGLIVDIMPNHSQRLESREFFLKLDAGSAFELISCELTLLYEVFYTKILAANSSWGVLIRSVTFYLYVVALVLFCTANKEGMHNTDVWITNALLAGVIVLDTVSELMLINSN
ncbi:hypothetical protein MLD38_019327 [Melastoma candidum]|uniref:Uncharacterized protein n=1 Tax=Melastoma candidum TaxID=119954 RepID=A0ACB9QYJ2_9MYRT|nr:hypothetical protein MLD38_019327 [Melastoma candidum]